MVLPDHPLGDSRREIPSAEIADPTGEQDFDLGDVTGVDGCAPDPARGPLAARPPVGVVTVPTPGYRAPENNRHVASLNRVAPERAA